MTVSGTRSFFLTDAASEAINLRGGVGKPTGGRTANYSQALNAIVERYASLMTRYLPDLSDDEWRALDALVPRETEWTPSLISLLPNLVQVEAQRQGSADVAALVTKLQLMELVERLALVDHLETRAGQLAASAT